MVCSLCDPCYIALWLAADSAVAGRTPVKHRTGRIDRGVEAVGGSVQVAAHFVDSPAAAVAVAAVSAADEPVEIGSGTIRTGPVEQHGSSWVADPVMESDCTESKLKLVVGVFVEGTGRPVAGSERIAEVLKPGSVVGWFVVVENSRDVMVAARQSEPLDSLEVTQQLQLVEAEMQCRSKRLEQVLPTPESFHGRLAPRSHRQLVSQSSDCQIAFPSQTCRSP